MTWRYKKRELLHSWVDYFKAKIIDNWYKPKIQKLGLSDNSNLYFYDSETTIKLESNEVYWQFDYYFSIIDTKTNINLAFLLIPWSKTKLWAVERNNIFETTWQWLILRNVKFYYDLIKWSWFQIEKFMRVDICFDMEINIWYIFKNVFKEQIENKTQNLFIKSWIVESFYIWDRSKEKNTYQLIRIYNKKLDSHNKWKAFLYPQRKDKENVTRFEVEIRRDKAKFIKPEMLLNIDYIFSIIVKTFYWFNTQFFKFIHQEDFKMVHKLEMSAYKQRKLNIEERQNAFIKYWNDFFNDKDKNKTIKMFISYAKKLYKNGFYQEKLIEILEINEIFKSPDSQD